jgi:hypothetical protein
VYGWFLLLICFSRIFTRSQQEQQNPDNNVESFDAIYYAVLQVIITAAANGVCISPVLLFWIALMYNVIVVAPNVLDG